MTKKGTFNFDRWHVEIVDPVVSFSNVDENGEPIIEEVNKAAMTISVSVLLTTDNGSKYEIPPLDGINVENLDYTTASNVMDRVSIRLDDFKI